MNDPLDELRQKFRYVGDKKDKWTILCGENWGGDCDDFALTALWLISGKSWLRFWWMIITFQAMFWQASTPGGPHIMLWVKEKGWIDNWYRKWSSGPRHKRVFPYIAPFLAIVLLVK